MSLLRESSTNFLRHKLAHDSEGLRIFWEKILQRFTEYGIKLNAEKCVFDRAEVAFVGRRVSAAGIHPGFDIAAGLQQLKIPETEKELGDFLWGWDYFRGFIPNYASLVAPGRRLLTQIQAKRFPLCS